MKENQIRIIAISLGIIIILVLIGAEILFNNYLNKGRVNIPETSNETSTSTSSETNTSNETSTSNEDELTIKGYDTTTYNKVDLKEFLKISKTNSLELTFLGKENCGACRLFVPILNEVQEEYGFKVNYVNTNEIDSTSKEFSDLTNLFSSINHTFDYVPMLMITKNNKLIDSSSGVKQKGELTSYLEQYDVIGK